MLTALAPDAFAATAVHRIDIPARPASEALLTLARQAGVSIGGADPASCAATSRAVRGRMTAERALRAMLAGSRCDVRRLDARTFSLELRPEPRRRPPPPLILQDESAPQEILITRRPIRADLLPRGVSVVPAGAVIQNDYDLGKLATRVPGMAITNLGPGRNKILLRGISDSVLTGRTQSTVGLYLDDSPLTYNAPDPDLLLVDVARVEVLKGPQGALYGQGSLSGVVRLVTNKPRSDIFEADIGGAIGFTDSSDPSWRATAMMNLPLVRDKAALRAVIYSDEAGGYIVDAAPGRDMTNATSRAGGRATLAVALNSRWFVTGSLAAQTLNSENSQYVTSPDQPFRRDLLLAEPHDNRFTNLAATLQGDVESGTLKVSIHRLNHDLSSGYNARPLQGNIPVTTSGSLFYDERQRIELTTSELSFTSPSNGKFRWLTGLFMARSVEHFDPHLSDVQTRRDLYDESRIDRVSDIAAFGHVIYEFRPKWTGSLGLRATSRRHETDSVIDHVQLSGYAPSGRFSGRIEDSHIAHTAVLNYHPRPGLVLYVQTGDGFRTGGFNTTTQIVTAYKGAYEGDGLTSYELGAKYNSPHNRLRLNITGFHIVWRDIQSDQLRLTGLPVTVNLGDGVNNGIEIEADWRVNPSLSLHAAAQINDPRLNRPVPLFAGDEDGGMPFISRQSYSLSADWVHTVGGLTLQNSATLSYRGKAPVNYGLLRDVRMDAYTNLDVSSFIDFEDIRFGVRINNVTNVRGNSFAYGNPFTIAATSQITPLRPRTLWLSVSKVY